MLELSEVPQWVDRTKAWPWRTIAIGVSASFIVASAVSTVIGYGLMRQLSSPAGSKVKITAEDAPVASGPTLNKADIDRILERNIFNSEGATGDASAPTVSADTVVRTQLPIKVTGIIYGGNPFNGIALIESTQKKTVNSFMVGDPLPPDATIKEIQVDRILIDIQGRTEFAPLEDTDIIRSNRKGKKLPKTDSGKPASGGSPGFATEPPPETFKEEGFERKGGEIQMTQEYKNKLLTTEFANVLQDAKASPNVVDGVLRGWRMERIRKDSIYEKAGVQNGDVIEEINGVVLTDAGQSIKLLQSLRNESEIEIRLMRNGTRMNVMFKIR